MWPQPSVSLAGNMVFPHELRMEYSSVVRAVHDFEARQASQHAQVVSTHDLDLQLSRVQIDAASGHFTAAKADIRSLKQALANWNLELNGGTHVGAVAAGSGVAAVGTMRLPILLYHYPPPNFEQQIEHLEQAGYTSIDLDQALAGLQGGPLPAKPVVITFDDGFAPQMQAFEILKRHNMKATYYIITSGEESRWCIGSGRRYGDPLQPAGGCGDAYLNWDQVRLLDKSGLITIGGHTVNHRNLASLSEADQRFEIINGKQALEAQLGHGIRHFAYPYGAYNAESIQIAREAGYVTAVTTLPGEIQTDGSPFTLRRVRDAMVLP
jgi:peptidoglycan/xylan/chitin deacetylase (PgdA/CDA1 family)